MATKHSDIIKKAKKGDKDAFSELVTLYGDNLYGFALGLTGGDAATAADIYQEALLRAYRYIHTYNPDYAFSTWLWNICRNTYLTLLKKQGRMNTIPLAAEGRESVLPASDNTEKSVSHRERRRILLSLIGELSVNDREILSLVELRDLKIKKAAKLLGITENTAKVRVHRARKRLYERAVAKNVFSV